MRKLSALAGAIVVVWATVNGQQIQDTQAGTVGSDQQRPGTCHAFATEYEAITISDVAPPVPCTAPHQTETYFADELPRDLGGDTGPRPGLEATVALMRDLCTDTALATYMGADTYDEPAFLTTWTRVPTAEEWARGERTFHCDASPSVPPGGAPPQLTTSLQGVLRSHEGDAYRRCYDGETSVPCDLPHTAEHVRSWVAIPPEVRSHQIPDSWAMTSCAELVSAFLGQDATQTGHRVQAVAYPGVHPAHAECRVAIPDGAGKLTGSLSKTVRDGDAG